MITRWSIAHERLQQKLQVRTHRRPEPREGGLAKSRARNADRRRPVEFNGKVYKTFTSAYRALRISPNTLRTWIDTGKAKHVHSNPR